MRANEPHCLVQETGGGAVGYKNQSNLYNIHCDKFTLHLFIYMLLTI